jgi:hypothetical protein
VTKVVSLCAFFVRRFSYVLSVASPYCCPALSVAYCVLSGCVLCIVHCVLMRRPMVAYSTQRSTVYSKHQCSGTALSPHHHCGTAYGVLSGAVDYIGADDHYVVSIVIMIGRSYEWLHTIPYFLTPTSLRVALQCAGQCLRASLLQACDGVVIANMIAM